MEDIKNAHSGSSSSAPTKEQVAKVREEVKKELAEEEATKVKKALPKPGGVAKAGLGGGSAPAAQAFEAGPQCNRPPVRMVVQSLLTK